MLPRTASAMAGKTANTFRSPGKLQHARRVWPVGICVVNATLRSRLGIDQIASVDLDADRSDGILQSN